jgi:hypothetical protein
MPRGREMANRAAHRAFEHAYKEEGVGLHRPRQRQDPEKHANETSMLDEVGFSRPRGARQKV